MHIHLSDVQGKQIVEGYNGKFLHSANMTLVYWDIKKDAPLPEHSHVHEQVVNMLEGEFELVVDGVPHHLKPGDVFIVPSNARHSGKAITDCRILDVFYPIREDYK